MAEITTIARPYAEAVARIAKETNSWAAWLSELSLLAAVVQDEQVAGITGNPAVSSERVAELLTAICDGKLSENGKNFVSVLAENKRYSALPEILRLFEEIKSAQEGVLDAVITTAYELTPGQLTDLIAKLEIKMNRKISATQQVDIRLIGGVVIQVGDEVLDASVRGKLEGLSAALKA